MTIVFCCILQKATAQKHVEIGTPGDTTTLQLMGLDNTNSLEWDNGNQVLRHHYNTYATKRDWMRLFLDSDNNQTNSAFSIFRDTAGVNGYDILPVVQFHLDGFDSWLNSGKFGLGTAAPSAMLHISAPAGTDPLRIQLDGTTKLRLFENGSLSLGINNTNISDNDVYIHHDLGIGINQPVERLDVNGAIRIGSNLSNSNGVIRYTGVDFQGYSGGQWKSLVSDADGDPANELQSITKVGTNVTLSQGGGTISVVDNDNLPNNELQSLSRSGTNVTLSTGGGTVSIADNDNSTSNEIQTLNLSGSLLSISGGNSVTIPTDASDRIVDSDGDTFVDAEYTGDDDRITVRLEGQTRGYLAKTATSDRTYLSFPNNGGNILIGATGSLTANSGSDNIYIGTSVGAFNQAGSDNVMIGDGVGALFNGQAQNVYVGKSVATGNGGDNNVTMGYQAGSTGNYSNAVVIGYQAGQHLANEKSVLIGYQAGQNLNSGSSFHPAVCIGYQAGNALTGVVGNTLIGHEAGKSIVDGQNTMIGQEAGHVATTSEHNTLVGYQAGMSMTSGDKNTLIGRQAGSAITTGYENTHVGWSGVNLTSGYANTFVGYQSGNGVTTGFRNTFVGMGAAPTSGGFDYSSGIGYATVVSANNQIRIGATNVTSIGGHTSWSNLSDGRYKSDVRETVPGLAFVRQLRPVTYNLDVIRLEEDLRGIDNSEMDSDYLQTLEEKQQIAYSGFIAQEVEQAAMAAGYDFSGVDAPKHEGDFYALRYAEFVVPLVKSVQELDATDSAMQQRMDNLEAQVALLTEQMASRDAALHALQAQVASLIENTPNR